MKKLLLILSILSMTVTVFAAFGGTDAGTRITNSAFVGGNNFSNTTNGIGTNVLEIVGGTWTSTDADEGNGTAGNTFRFTTYLSNNGNTNELFALYSTNIATNGGAPSTGGAWTAQFTNATTGADNITISTLAVAEVENLIFRVAINAGAQNGAWREYVLVAQAGNGTDTTADQYTGDNTTVYGGTIGQDGTYGTGYVVMNSTATADPRRWRLTVLGPNISIVKTIDSVAIADGNAPGNAAYPGATITYKLTLTNSGGGDANGLYVRDSEPANTTLVAGSLRCEVNEASTTNSWAGTPAAGTAGDINGSDIEFTPGGNNADATSIAGTENGLIESEANGNDAAACFYQVTID